MDSDTGYIEWIQLKCDSHYKQLYVKMLKWISNIWKWMFLYLILLVIFEFDCLDDNFGTLWDFIEITRVFKNISRFWKTWWMKL